VNQSTTRLQIPGRGVFNPKEAVKFYEFLTKPLTLCAGNSAIEWGHGTGNREFWQSPFNHDFNELKVGRKFLDPSDCH
jgi:hypothetical protein